MSTAITPEVAKLPIPKEVDSQVTSPDQDEVSAREKILPFVQKAAGQPNLPVNEITPGASHVPITQTREPGAIKAVNVGDTSAIVHLLSIINYGIKAMLSPATGKSLWHRLMDSRFGRKIWHKRQQGLKAPRVVDSGYLDRAA